MSFTNYENVILEVEDGIGVLTINHHSKREFALLVIGMSSACFNH